MDRAARNAQVHPTHRDESGEFLGEIARFEDDLVVHGAAPTSLDVSMVALGAEGRALTYWVLAPGVASTWR